MSFIITKVGNPFKGYMGVVKDVLRGQDTASGLKIALQLEHVEFSSTFKRIVVDYDSVVGKLSVKDLHLHDSESESILSYPFFKDWNSTFGLCKAPKRSLSVFKGCVPGFPSRTFTTARVSTSGRATPMPDQTSSTPAWDLASHTPPQR